MIMKPYSMLVISIVDLRNRSFKEAQSIYMEARRKAFHVLNFIDRDMNWSMEFNLYQPPGIELRDLDLGLRSLDKNNSGIWSCVSARTDN